MNYKVVTIPPFDRQLKRLAKKFPSIKKDIENLGRELEINPINGAYPFGKVHIILKTYRNKKRMS